MADETPKFAGVYKHPDDIAANYRCEGEADYVDNDILGVYYFNPNSLYYPHSDGWTAHIHRAGGCIGLVDAGDADPVKCRLRVIRFILGEEEADVASDHGMLELLLEAYK